MLENQILSYTQSPLYRDAVQEFQQGKWESGLALLQQLEEAFPLETELRGWRQDILLRSRMDEAEVAEARRQQAIFLRHLGARLGLILVTILLIVGGVQLFSQTLKAEWQQTRDQLEVQVQTLELANKFRNGQNLLLAGLFTDRN